MVGLNTLLAESGLDPGLVQLVRHQDRRITTSKTPYSVWRADQTKFDAYQCLQGGRPFKTDWLAAFVVTPAGETLFVNVYRVGDSQPAVRPVTCPVSDKTFGPGEILVYQLRRDERLSDLSGRLVIDWGPGFRAWVQRAGRQNKPVLEIRQRFKEPDFPGFGKFTMRIDQLDELYEGWKGALSAVRGVYLLTFDDGEQYIGSASGDGGFLRRWLDY